MKMTTYELNVKLAQFALGDTVVINGKKYTAWLQSPRNYVYLKECEDENPG